MSANPALAGGGEMFPWPQTWVALPVSTSPAVLMFPLVSRMRHLLLLCEWVQGPVEAAPGTREAAAPGAERALISGKRSPSVC